MLSWFHSPFLVSRLFWDFSLSLHTVVCAWEKEKGRARESCIDTHMSNNTTAFRKNCQLWHATPAEQQQLEEYWRRNIITAKGCPVISAVLSPPCRTRFSSEVITFLHKYTLIYLLTACLLGMPLGHTSAENLNEDTIIMTLAVKSVKLTTLPQCRKLKPNQQYAMQETLMSHQQMSGWKCYSNCQTLRILARNPAFAVVFLLSPQHKCFALRTVEMPGSLSSLATQPISFRAQSLESFQRNKGQYAEHSQSQIPAPNQWVSFWNPVAKSRSCVPHSTKLLVPARLSVKVYKIITTDSYLCMWKLHSFSGIF